MNRIHEDLPDEEFEQPSTVERVTICSESGLLAGTGCSRTTEYFDLSDVPTKRCTEHVPVIIPTPTPRPTVTQTPSQSPDDTREESQEEPEDHEQEEEREEPEDEQDSRHPDRED